jgi:two-component system, LytTR family, sensor kinase
MMIFFHLALIIINFNTVQLNNKHNFNWNLIFIICITVIPFNRVYAQNKFGNNFYFETYTDFRGVRIPVPFSTADTMLVGALMVLDPVGWVYSDAKFLHDVFIKKGISSFGDSLKGDHVDTTRLKVRLKKNISPGLKPSSRLILGVKLNSTLEDWYTTDGNSISKQYASYIINDSSDAILIALGITTENVSEFKYHVVENDSIEIIPWSTIPKLEQNYGASRPYAFLGKYKAPGKQILIEVISSKNYSLRDGVIFDWRINYKPVVTQIIFTTPSDYFNLSYKKLNRNYATAFDSISGMPLNLKFPVDSIDNFRLEFKSHPTIPYVMFLKQTIHGKVEIKQIDYSVLKDYFDLGKENFKTPGKYELLIQRAGELNYFGEENILRFPFEVFEPDPGEKTFSTRQIILYVGVLLFLIAIAFLFYYLRNKRKLSLSVQLKEKSELQLKSIRSQLNPHFMFNALSSIQNLMDRKETSAANHYLSIFSRLTREVLNTGEKELISLEDEINLIDNYLKMEQLRFGFQYTLNIENGLNKANIEIPSMLLQPMVENAVKHGISSLRDKGVIDVSISRINQSLMLSVADNGKGFNKNKASDDISGLGIKLTNERISLLNKIYPEQPIAIEFNSSEQGTKVDIKLKDWL